MTTRRAATILAWLVAASVLACVAAAVVLTRIDLRPAVAWWTAAVWKHPVTVGGLHVALGNPVVVDLDDVRLAGPNGADAPQQGHVDHVTAELLPWPMLRGRLVFRHVSVSGLAISLDHRAGAGSGPAAAPAPAGSGRGGVPTILDLAVADSSVRIVTSSGNLLRIDAKTLALHTTGDDAPVSLTGAGAYNATPISLAGTLQSFDRLRDGGAPFGAAITATAADATVSLRGTLTDPLHADGLSGDLRADFGKLDTPLAIAGAAMRLDVPLTLAGPLRRQGDQWTLPALTGTLGGSAFTGSARITEGGRGGTDAIAVTLDLARLDVEAVLPAGSGETVLAIDPDPGAAWDARVGAKQVQWGGFQLGRTDVHLTVTAGRIAVPDASLVLAGGRLSGSAEAVPADQGIALTTHAALMGLDLGTLLGMTGTDLRDTIGGRVAGRMDLTLTGGTLAAAVGAARGQAMVAITEGRVARAALQAASTDLGLLFRREKGMTPMQCFLAVASVQDGVAALSPLRMRTPDGTLIGGGSVDLRRQTLDMTVQTLSGTTGFLALDLPNHITGPLANPSVRPGIRGEMQDYAARSAGNLRKLPADMVRLASDNPCAR